MMKKVFLYVLGVITGVFGYIVLASWSQIPLVATGGNGYVSVFLEQVKASFSARTPEVFSVDDELLKLYNVLDYAYYDTGKVHTGAMQQAAIKAFVNALEDPYTVYLDAEENEGLMESLQGQQDFEGIGAVVAKKDEGVLIQEVLKGAPAFLAGLQPLDTIVQVDETSVVDMPLDESIDLIRGPKGSTVLLKILRTKKGESYPVLLEISVTRDAISVPSVSSDVYEREAKTIGYLAISVVGEETEELLRKEIRTLQEKNIEGLVIDLRGNGGGLLDISVAVLSHFVPAGELLVEAKYRVLQDEIFYAKGGKDFGDIPVVVLIDGLTASAGEIIALSLQETIGATLVGDTTFGKGSIQTIEDFSDNSSLKYTIGKRYSPKGNNIDQVGVVPDVSVEFDKDLYEKQGVDTQLEKAIEILS